MTDNEIVIEINKVNITDTKYLSYSGYEYLERIINHINSQNILTPNEIYEKYFGIDAKEYNKKDKLYNVVKELEMILDMSKDNNKDFIQYTTYDTKWNRIYKYKSRKGEIKEEYKEISKNEVVDVLLMNKTYLYETDIDTLYKYLSVCLENGFKEQAKEIANRLQCLEKERKEEYE